MDCPSCRSPMDNHTFAGNYGKSVVIDLCFGCGAIWFDGFENLQLTPGSILELFKLIHEKHPAQQRALAKPLLCPRCRRQLEHTGDLQRTTRFFYDRCPQNHGRFITFFQFLREKNFVRSLTFKEITELKQRVRMLHCSNCGASIELETTSTCTYCGSPVSMLDPQQMEKTVQELQAAEKKRSTAQGAQMGDLLQIERLSSSRFATQATDASFLTVDLFDLVFSGIDIVSDTFGDS
ncbi:MAG: zf-TFIIB domain-containing protein [Candidatus Binatia bacterium]